MSFSIPKKAWLSFSQKQVIDSLYRMGNQIDQGWHKKDYRKAEITKLRSNLSHLQKNHPSGQIQKFTGEIQNLLKEEEEIDQRQFQNFLMAIEREDQRDLKDEDFIISTEDSTSKKNDLSIPMVLVLDNMRSSFNVGSLFRTAESFSIQEIHLCGYTPTPDNSKTARSSLGAEKWIKWNYWESTFECLEELKNRGFKIFGFETAQNAIDLKKVDLDFPAALLLGNERYGLSPEVLKKVDQTIVIPMQGRKNSLNVAVCGAIGIHHFTSAYEPLSQ